ncbi:MAG: transketolase [Alphaproteobacteria bacterium]|nr:transketolase [Alphaproteobacteria bacterium]
MAADMDLLCINTIRTLAMDAVQQANSGHPGSPMGLAPGGYTLWNERLSYDPADPLWPNRDRFVLSVGHASMLLYALLYLAQVQPSGGKRAVSLDEIKRFRQLGSACPGHPEHHLTSGVECTTGPLGQGVANSVGMAIAERWLGVRYNRPGFPLIEHNTYAFCGDGDMMEGVSGEAASLAAHLRLANLCWVYDSNRISIEGSTALAFSEDVGARFLAYGWNVLRVRDANDRAALSAAFRQFDRETARPTLIIVESHIAYGAPHKQDTAAAHGEPLGEEEIRLTKRNYGWPEDAKFLVPEGVREHFAQGIGARGAAAHAAWREMFARYRTEYPDLAHEFELIEKRELPQGWEQAIADFPADPKGLATRDSSGKVLNALAERVPWLLGGSADLAPSTKTNLGFKGAGGSFEADNYAGRNFHFGVREHAMGAICNGMALSNLRVYGSGFLIFSDYMRGAIRLSAITELPVVWIFTHDSIGVGEDGPTHQPIEQLAGLRSMPGLHTIRPCDANEVAEAWRILMRETHAPTCLALSRQALPTIDRSKYNAAAGLARGAYVLADPPGGAGPELILMASGSEVQLCIDAYEKLTAEGVRVRVVSMPSWDIFERQDEAYRRSIFPEQVRARVAVEQAATLGWDRYAGSDGRIVGMHTFGASAPIKALLEHFGFTAETVLAAARDQLGRHAVRKAAE